jgi:hypothetical protein
MSSRRVNLLDAGHSLVHDLTNLRGQVMKDEVDASKALSVTRVSHVTCRAIKTTVETDQWLTRKAVLKAMAC